MKLPRRLLVLPLLCSLASPLHAQKVPVVEKTLANGMRLLLVQRNDEPSVAGGWVAHVGSANERPGMTGIAHLFEHMMFKGTPTIGTKDYQKDQEIIAEQERVREDIRREEAKMRALLRRGEIDDMLKPENKTARYKELEVKFKELVDAQRQLLVKNEFDRIYTTGGASGMNAFTTADITGYFITVPANKLELWMWMESERLYHPVFREFYAERDVVFEERRMRTEATPTGRLEESFESLFWESHPYGWPTVGWPSDIPAISKAQADDFYGLYYSPQNITLILVGDFDTARAAEMAEKYFARIPRGGVEPPDVVTLEIKQAGEKRLYGEAETNPQVDILWHTPAFGHPDNYALQVLSALLNGRTGRLYKDVVVKQELATEVSAGVGPRKWAGQFGVSGEAKDGHTPEEVERACHEVLEKLKQEDVPAEELQKVKNNFAAGEYRRLGGNMSILMQLIRTDGNGNWREINDAGPKVQAVTAADVRRVAGKYLTKDNRAVAITTRKGGASPAGEDPDLAGLTPQQMPMVRQVLSRLKAESNVEQLKKSLQQLEERSPSADAKNKQLMNLLKKKTAERIAELEKK